MDALEIHVAEILSIKKIILKKVRVCEPLPIFLIWSNKEYVNHVMCFKTEDEPKDG